MYALLGDIEFNLVTAFDGLELQTGSDYAEHALIGRKPRLQHVGEKLDELRFQLKYHAHYCDPEVEIGRLRLAQRARQPMPFIQGNGDFRGTFVITELSTVAQHTDAFGTLIAVEATMTLREYTGDPAKPLPQAVIRSGASLPVTLTRQAVRPGASLSALAVTAVKTSASVVGDALSSIGAVKALIIADPVAAYIRLQKVRQEIEGQLPQWKKLGDNLVVAVKRESAQAAVGLVVQGMDRAFPEMQQITAIAAAAAQNALPPALSMLEPHVQSAESALRDITGPLARLAATIGGRRL